MFNMLTNYSGTNTSPSSQVYYDAQKGQYYTVTGQQSMNIMGHNTITNPGTRNYLGSTVGQNPSKTVRTPFQPNRFTQGQLSGSSNMTTPQWMMDAYTNKIGQMGGNANPPVPFGVNQSGFPGMGNGVQSGFPGQGSGVQSGFPGQGGKTAPSQG
jgi:hypothetical protein